MPSDVIEHRHGDFHENPRVDVPPHILILDEMIQHHKFEKPYMREPSRENDGETQEGLDSLADQGRSETFGPGSQDKIPRPRTRWDDTEEFIRDWSQEPVFRLAFYIGMLALRMKQHGTGQNFHNFEIFPERDKEKSQKAPVKDSEPFS